LVDNRNKFYSNLIIGTTLSAFACFISYEFSHVVLEGKNYIATVNNRYITVTEFKERVNTTKKQYANQMGVDFKTTNGQNTYNDIKKKVVKELILTKIILQNADQEKIVVTDAMLEQQIAKIKKGSFHDNEFEFKKALQKNDLTESSLRKMMWERLMIQGYTEKLFEKNIKITEKYLRDSYEAQKKQYTKGESVEAAHILVKDEKKAKEIRALLTKGEDFATLAKKYSIDPGSKTTGGQLGYFSEGQMVPEFEKAAFALKVGEISQPVKTNFGYHIIKKTGYKPPQVTPFAEVRKNLEAQAKSEKQAAFFTQWKDKAEKDAEVKYNPAYESYFAEKQPETKGSPANTTSGTGEKDKSTGQHETKGSPANTTSATGEKDKSTGQPETKGSPANTTSGTSEKDKSTGQPETKGSPANTTSATGEKDKSTGTPTEKKSDKNK